MTKLNKLILIILFLSLIGLSYYAYSLQKRIEKLETFTQSASQVINTNAQIQQSIIGFLNTMISNAQNPPKK